MAKTVYFKAEDFLQADTLTSLQKDLEEMDEKKACE